MKKVKRPWGWYRVLSHSTNTGYKIKELEIDPGLSLSNQRHLKRNEYWYVLEGTVKIETEWKKMKDTVHLNQHSGGYNIGKRVWHCASNPTKKPIRILEVQYGEICEEEDIERKD
jgi:mannose-1-phosphate guanylyltransferase/mannose-6-phosphate isomerase